MSGKILVAFYSHSGNTKQVAEMIHSMVGGDLFEIKTVDSYPANYNDLVNLAKKEKADGYKPELTEMIDIKDYDIICLGSPVWWYTFATPIRTFLSNADFTGKTIIPFCTHGGGGASDTFADIQKLCPKAVVKEGFAGYDNAATREEIAKWIESIK